MGKDRERQENRKTKTMRKIKTRHGWTQHAGGQRQREIQRMTNTKRDNDK